MIQPMSYPVDFQRVYAVLAVAWVGFVFIVTPADRLKFWTADLQPVFRSPDDWVTVDPSDVVPNKAPTTSEAFLKLCRSRLHSHDGWRYVV